MNPVIFYLFNLTTPNPPLVAEVQERWAGAKLDVEVVSVHCEEDNAAYYPDDRVVIMCDDLYDRPELAKWILGHELAHAFTDQHDVPMTYKVDEERSADELAFLTSEPEESYAAASWFLQLHKRHPMHDPKDPHPSHLDRAGELLCLLDGMEPRGERLCRVMLETVQGSWMRTLEFINRAQ